MWIKVVSHGVNWDSVDTDLAAISSLVIILGMTRAIISHTTKGCMLNYYQESIHWNLSMTEILGPRILAIFYT